MKEHWINTITLICVLLTLSLGMNFYFVIKYGMQTNTAIDWTLITKKTDGNYRVVNRDGSYIVDSSLSVEQIFTTK